MRKQESEANAKKEKRCEGNALIAYSTSRAVVDSMGELKLEDRLRAFMQMYYAFLEIRRS